MTIGGPVLLVDGLNVFMRHFCANPSMAETGQHVGGFLGFLGGLGNLCEKFNPSRVIVVWESGGSLRKRSVDSTYKGGRRPPSLNRYYEDDIPPTAENHTMQVSLLVKALNHLPVTQIYVRDCEADDVIGYLGRYTFGSTRIILVSSDRDLYQLISDHVHQWSPGQKKLITRADIVDKFGISPENFISARVFIGDSSDNIEGVKGTGFKTMSKWFPEIRDDKFVSHSEIIARAKTLIEDGNTGKTIARISESQLLTDKNWKLMYLSTSRLAGVQIKKVNDQLEKRGKSDKMALMRLLLQSGMQKFDINRHFRAINSTRNS